MKKTIITSALPYANGEIHLGHVASTYLPADITTRFLKLNGVEAYYICASDDYGTPILIQAEREKKTPEEYVKFWNKRDYEDFTAFGIEFDFFYRTSSPENITFVQDVFRKLMENGHIYEKEIIQFYCKIDKKLLPDRYVIGRCPYCKAEEQYSDLCEKCGRVPQEIEEPTCSICKNPPTKQKTKHYFFKLTNFTGELNEWLEVDSHLQKDVKKYVQNWIKDGLVDWDITRDISWGVPIPLEEAKGKVFYGWFDNHLAYISSSIKFLNEKGLNGKEFWNAADIYHFIGKDIVYHHYLFLPAMRIGIKKEYKLPDYIPTRGHLMLQSKKISKFSANFNQYFQKKEPWKSRNDNENCIFLSVNAVRSMAIALFPFLPESSQRIWSQLNMNGNVSAQNWASISEIAIKTGHKIGEASPLFKKVEMVDIETYKSRLGK